MYLCLMLRHWWISGYSTSTRPKVHMYDPALKHAFRELQPSPPIPQLNNGLKNDTYCRESWWGFNWINQILKCIIKYLEQCLVHINMLSVVQCYSDYCVASGTWKILVYFHAEASAKAQEKMGLFYVPAKSCSAFGETKWGIKKLLGAVDMFIILIVVMFWQHRHMSKLTKFCIFNTLGLFIPTRPR